MNTQLLKVLSLIVVFVITSAPISAQSQNSKEERKISFELVVKNSDNIPIPNVSVTIGSVSKPPTAEEMKGIDMETAMMMLAKVNTLKEIATVLTDSNGRAFFKDKLEVGVETYAYYFGEKFQIFPPQNSDMIKLKGLKAGETARVDIWSGPTKIIGVGEQAPDTPFFEVSTGKEVKLSDFKGQVVYIDFWATWCSPCQGAMSKADKLMEKNAAKWKGKAVILGLCCVKRDVKYVQAHIKKKQWNTMPQYVDKVKTGGLAPISMVFGIKKLPTAILIDKGGKIVYRGHPSRHNAEEHINKLLKEK